MNDCSCAHADCAPMLGESNCVSECGVSVSRRGARLHTICMQRMRACILHALLSVHGSSIRGARSAQPGVFGTVESIYNTPFCVGVFSASVYTGNLGVH